jgi:ubiquinone/menaquinone biosynthesis C-methylase UbiE
VTPQGAPPDYSAIASRQRTVWAAGNFAKVAAGVSIAGEFLCEAVELHARERVLDVATGSGNTAIAAAQRRCVVTGLDFVESLLARAKERATNEGLEIEFRTGNAMHLPFADGSFDCVLSTFGAMFAPDQAGTAKELLRVCRPGGRIGMANWTPSSFPGAMFRVLAEASPPPAGLQSPMRWGTELGLRELFDAREGQLELTPRVAVLRGDTPAEFVAQLRRYFGPAVKAFEALDTEQQAALARSLEEAAHRFNRATDGTVFLPSEYLEIVVRKR